MTVCRWDTLECIWGRELTAWDVAGELGISITTAHTRLFRAYYQGWLKREKVNGVFVYSWSMKAWNFFEEYGSFITGNPYYG